ncbi:triacylglycerol lipase [Kwoniella heveanensis BCC8398]|uniref:Triacylglycerol lipase n=1 Tax=Kwoniella heveanensis BCC8398 TaxID=1296120 RepID=A0A1B9GUE8_9TREE|nr:triacylglycerol lipase [Kwoniella heveanensis BCC8398]
MSHYHKPDVGHPAANSSSHRRHSHSSSHTHTHHDHLQHHHSRAQARDQQNAEDAVTRRLVKGKQRADAAPHIQVPSLGQGTGTPDEPLSAMLDEALHTSLSPPSISSSLESSFERASPIPEPPLAHYHAPLRPHAPPRLLSQLTRSTLPISSFTYQDQDRQRHSKERSNSRTGIPREGESSSAWQRSRPTTAICDEPFPDLDPTTGLPIDSRERRGSTASDAPSLHLQRTITGLLSTPTRKSTESSLIPSLPSLPNLNLSLPRVSLPSAPFLPRVSLPPAPSLDFGRRSISSTAPQEDWSTWASGWWNGNKGKVDEMMSEEDRADTVEEEKEKLRKKYRSPKNPVVFCHGLLGFDYLGPASLPPLQISHWRGIREVLESNGVEVLIARVPATSSIKDRAAILEQVISEKYPGREVNLIGHSMGGLDCRYLISENRPKAFRPISLTTISTPHRGSPFADYVIESVIGRDRLPSLLSLVETLRLPNTGDGTAFSALGTHAMREFNAQVLDKEDVSYFSWGASFEPGLLDTFRWPHSVILAKEGPNDGLVSVHSAMWGEYRGTLVGVNHLDLVGWVNTVRYAMAGWTGKPIAFKPATFYLEVNLRIMAKANAGKKGFD